jgi:hypothetical protein
VSTYKERINITNLAKEIKISGPQPTLAIDPFKSSLQVYAELKPELYAIAAVIIDDIVARANPEDVSFRKYSESSPGPFNRIYEFSGFVKSQMAKSQETLFDELEAFMRDGDKSPLTRSYKRLKLLTSILAIRFPHIPRYQSPSSFIQAGINTGNDAAKTVLSIIPFHAQGKADDLGLDRPSFYTDIANNSYPLLASIAMIHIEDLGPFSRDLFRGGVLPITQDSLFTLKPIPQGYGYALDFVDGLEAARKNILADEYLEPSEKETPLIGCPAMVNVTGQNAVKKVLEWYIAAGRDLYS